MRYNGGYGNYGEYGARMRDSRGRYAGDYGRRGVPGSGRGRYRGYDYIDDMNEQYGNYSESKDSYRRGNYGAGEDSMKSLDYMLKSVQQFMKMLKEDADNQEEVEMIQEYARKIGAM